MCLLLYVIKSVIMYIFTYDIIRRITYPFLTQQVILRVDRLKLVLVGIQPYEELEVSTDI